MKNTKVKDFQQKRRNKAIGITDIAISKIRKTEFFGFTTEQEEKIQELHKTLLRTAQMLNIKHATNDMEAGILVDLHTWESWVLEGKISKMVKMEDNMLAYDRFVSANKNQLMFMHNHPSTGTFSGTDFKFFCNNDVFYMITVVANNGTIYALTKTSNFDIRVLAEYAKLSKYYYDLGHINNNGTLAMRDILKIASEYGIVYKKGGHK